MILFQLQCFRVFGTVPALFGLDCYHLAVVLMSINYLSLDGRRHESMQSKKRRQGSFKWLSCRLYKLEAHILFQGFCGIQPYKNSTLSEFCDNIDPNSQMLCFKRHQKIEMTHLALRAGGCC